MRLSDVEVYEKYASELARFATGLVGPDDAADVVADAFVNVLGSRSWDGVDDQKGVFISVGSQPGAYPAPVDDETAGP